MPTTPILFHDIDGVLFGNYAGEFQLRPGVKSWLAWAHEHFEVIWLTVWESDKVKALLHVLYCERFRSLSDNPPFHHANWMNYENKVVWLQQAIPKLKNREWFWIDDEIDKWAPAIQLAGLSLDRCIQVNPEGRDELLILQATLTCRLHDLSATTPRSSSDQEAA